MKKDIRARQRIEGREAIEVTSGGTANLNLRDVFVYVNGNERIINWSGFKTVSPDSELAALNALQEKGSPRSKLFTGGISLFHKSIKDTDVINIAIPGLRDYYERKPLDSDTQMMKLFCSIKDTFTFYNVRNYNSLSDGKLLGDWNRFQLIGDLTPYDVLYMTGLQFREAVASNLPILFMVEGAVPIRINYDKSDKVQLKSWSSDDQVFISLPNQIDIQTRHRIVTVKNKKEKTEGPAMGSLISVALEANELAEESRELVEIDSKENIIGEYTEVHEDVEIEMMSPTKREPLEKDTGKEILTGKELVVESENPETAKIGEATMTGTNSKRADEPSQQGMLSRLWNYMSTVNLDNDDDFPF